MGALLLAGLGELVTVDGSGPDGLGIVRDVAVVVDDGRIAWIGPDAAAPACDTRRDLAGRSVIPGFVDSHTHLVFAGDRAAEFAARMAGVPYDGGGIATTVAATRAGDDETLRALLASRASEARRQGTTTLEIKSGYGLDVDTEQRLLRLASEITSETTFLGAHVVPAGAQRDDYLALVMGEMLATCAPYARWIDVFCEPGSAHAFDEDESRAVLQAGMAAGLLPRVHGNQLGPGPGVRLAVEVGAASVDHCTYLSDADIDALASAPDTVATLLPVALTAAVLGGRGVLDALALSGRAPPPRRRGPDRAGQ